MLECAREESGGVQRVAPDGSAELILNLEDPMESWRMEYGGGSHEAFWPAS